MQVWGSGEFQRRGNPPEDAEPSTRYQGIIIMEQNTTIAETRTLDSEGYYTRLSARRVNKDGEVISEGGKDMGKRMNLLGGAATGFANFKEAKDHLRQQGYKGRELQQKAAELLCAKSTVEESQVRAAGAVAALNTKGFIATTLDITKTGKSATMRFQLLEPGDAAGSLVDKMVREHGLERTMELLKSADAKARSIDV